MTCKHEGSYKVMHVCVCVLCTDWLRMFMQSFQNIPRVNDALKHETQNTMLIADKK